MKVDRVISTNVEIEKKIKEMLTHSEHWATKWAASAEMNSKYYQQMMVYNTLKNHYITQLNKRLETDETKQLQNLCNDLTSFTRMYLAKNHFFTANPIRIQSVERVVKHSEEIQKTKLPTKAKLVEIAGNILKELNDTEKSHNNNLFSRKFTKSRLAHTYMSIFEENGINPNQRVFVKKANEFASNVDDTLCSCFPKLL